MGEAGGARDKIPGVLQPGMVTLAARDFIELDDLRQSGGGGNLFRCKGLIILPD